MNAGVSACYQRNDRKGQTREQRELQLNWQTIRFHEHKGMSAHVAISVSASFASSRTGQQRVKTYPSSRFASRASALLNLIDPVGHHASLAWTGNDCL